MTLCWDCIYMGNFILYSLVKHISLETNHRKEYRLIHEVFTMEFSVIAFIKGNEMRFHLMVTHRVHSGRMI